MNKQEFYKRFNKKTDKPLERGFCEIDGKKYYCLTNNGDYNHAFVNCDSFTYFVFLKAFYEMANSIKQDCVKPEFVNVRNKKGFIKGDILLKDFSLGEQKIEVLYESDGYKIKDAVGKLFYFEEENSLNKQMKQMKELSLYYNNPQIYQEFLKHYLYHYYLGDCDFHFENIEVFIDKNGKTRVSPLFDFSAVFYLSTDEYGDGSWGFDYNQLHLSPDFLKFEMIDCLKSEYPGEYENYSINDIDKEFFIKQKTMARFVKTNDMLRSQKSILNKAVADLEDKSFIDRLLNIDIDACLTDEIFTEELKTLIKAGVSFGKKDIEKSYKNYEEKMCE